MTDLNHNNTSTDQQQCTPTVLQQVSRYTTNTTTTTTTNTTNTTTTTTTNTTNTSTSSNTIDSTTNTSNTTAKCSSAVSYKFSVGERNITKKFKRSKSVTGTSKPLGSSNRDHVANERGSSNRDRVANERGSSNRDHVANERGSVFDFPPSQTESLGADNTEQKEYSMQRTMSTSSNCSNILLRQDSSTNIRSHEEQVRIILTTTTTTTIIIIKLCK